MRKIFASYTHGCKTPKPENQELEKTMVQRDIALLLNSQIAEMNIGPGTYVESQPET